MTDRPLPLDMTERDVKRVIDYLEDRTTEPTGETHDGQRLLIEILDCLRRIDDKLGRMLTDDAPKSR
jgi:hypothetical protein